jgi:hypothetical protein
MVDGPAGRPTVDEQPRMSVAATTPNAEYGRFALGRRDCLSAPATGPNSWSTPTKPALSGPAGPTDHAMILTGTTVNLTMGSLDD